MAGPVTKLAEQIKEQGRQAPAELPPLLGKARELALDCTKDPLTRALAFRAAGNAHQLLNQYSEALENYNEAVALLESAGDSVELGRTLSAKVGLLFFLSRFDELFACAVRAREIFEAAGDKARLARLDVNLAHAYHRQDRNHEALACCERALPILEDSGDREGRLAALINAAAALSTLHEFERAQEHYRKALGLSEDLRLKAWALQCRYNLAYLHYVTGQGGEALAELRELRAQFDAIHEDRHVCQCWLDEAEILLEIGDLDGALDCSRRARMAALQLGLNNEAGKALLFEAIARRRQGSETDALPLLNEAIQRFEKDSNGLWPAVSRLQAALFHGTREKASLEQALRSQEQIRKAGLAHWDAMAGVVVGRIQKDSGDLAGSQASLESALVLARQSRSQWMQFHASHELGAVLAATGDERHVDFLRQAEQMLDHLWDNLGSDELKIAFLADRENVYTRLVSSTVAKSAATAFAYSEKSRSRVLAERLAERNGAPGIESIQASLGPDETVLEFFVCRQDLHIFLLDRNSLEVFTVRDCMARLAEAWRHLERHLHSCSVTWERLGPVAHHLEATARAHLQEMYQALIEPVRPRLKRKLTIVPHGFLHGAPFHALHDGTAYLCDAHEIAYSPSAALYVSGIRRVAESGPLLVAFASGERTSIVEEIQELAGRMDGSTALINPSLAEFKAALRERRALVHIAGHAGIDPVNGTLSWIETRDGLLTSRDLASMPILAETIVVTGCHTARRAILPGDEWQGLMRSFYLAGANTVISAFWGIRDEAARRFARWFHTVYDGTNPTEAVHLASQVVREWRPHPYFWAGFGAFVRKTVQEVGT